VSFCLVACFPHAGKQWQAALPARDSCMPLTLAHAFSYLHLRRLLSSPLQRDRRQPGTMALALLPFNYGSTHCPCPLFPLCSEIIANLAKAAGLATMIAAMRPDIDNVDEYVRNTTARAFSGGLSQELLLLAGRVCRRVCWVACGHPGCWLEWQGVQLLFWRLPLPAATHRQTPGNMNIHFMLACPCSFILQWSRLRWASPRCCPSSRRCASPRRAGRCARLECRERQSYPCAINWLLLHL